MKNTTMININNTHTNSEEKSYIYSVMAFGDCLDSHKCNGKSEQDTLHFTSKGREHNISEHRVIMGQAGGA